MFLFFYLGLKLKYCVVGNVSSVVLFWIIVFFFFFYVDSFWRFGSSFVIIGLINWCKYIRIIIIVIRYIFLVIVFIGWMIII